MKDNINELLELAKHAACLALDKVAELDRLGVTSYSFSEDLPREAKADADIQVEKVILGCLKETGLDILSEEVGSVAGNGISTLRFIIDPIDGTVNFVRGIGNCSVSVALFDGDTPVFGVIASYPSGELFWGGKRFGSFSESGPLRVSSISEKQKGVLCTGFPSRLEFDSRAINVQVEKMSNFGKIRMLGSASQSLLQVAKGSVECYLEYEIMLWDVAAGIALIEGAGGRVESELGTHQNSLNIVAHNNMITL